MKVKIGLEVHVYLNVEKIKTKLFCPCKVNYQEAEPNTNICPRCTGMPGAKPMLPNKEAVDRALAIALMLDCQIPTEPVLFQRKHYDWPDMPYGYQKTMSGSYSVPTGVKGEFNGVGIWQVHIEEDPAKWDPQTGRVDYNRAGVPLVEIVTAPDLKSADQARLWIRQLITTLSYIKAIQKDAGIKADVNVSIEGHPRVEVKNVNSFKSICRAIEYELLRQQEALKEGKQMLSETRMFHDKTQTTRHMRFKETAEEYMFIPEPDLPAILIDTTTISKIKDELPESSVKKVQRLTKEYKLSREDALVIASDLQLANLFEVLVKKVRPDIVVRWLRRDLLKYLYYDKRTLEDVNIDANSLLELLELVQEKKITDNTAKDILLKLIKGPLSPKSYVKEHGLKVVNDLQVLKGVCKEVVEENERAVQDYLSGEEKALHFLMGKVMAKTKGTATPREVTEIIKKLIK